MTALQSYFLGLLIGGANGAFWALVAAGVIH